jgi:hypothetical protein
VVDYGRIGEMIQMEVRRGEEGLRSEIERRLAEFELRIEKRVVTSPIRKNNNRLVEESTLSNHFD